MLTLNTIALTRAPLADLHARFHAVIPVLQNEGNVAFRSLKREEDREDAVAEATLTAWRRFLRAVTESVAINPIDLARWAIESVIRRQRRQMLLAA
jgi:hypothetical protein